MSDSLGQPPSEVIAIRVRLVSILPLALAALVAVAWLVVRTASPVAGAYTPPALPPPTGERSAEPFEATVASRASLAREDRPLLAEDPAPPSGPEDVRAPGDGDAAPGLTVLVTDDVGGPIPEARIFLAGGSSATRERTTTDARGHAELHLGEVGDRLVVLKDGYRRTEIALGDPPWDAPTIVVLPVSRVWLEAFVVDALGVPVAGADVHVFADSTTFETRTDADGRFTIDADRGEPPQRLAVHVVVAGHRFPLGGTIRPWSEWVALGWPRLVIERIGVVTITVEDPAGVAIGDAAVRLMFPPAQLGEVPLRGRQKVTAANGEGASGAPLYALDAPAGTRWWIEAERGDDEVARIELGPVAPGQRLARTLRLGLRQRTRFVVRDGAGEPIADAAIELRLRNTGPRYEERSDERGRFSYDTRGYPFTVAVRANGFEPWRGSFGSATSPDEPIDITLRASELGTEVRVRDDDGRPLANVAIRVREQDAVQAVVAEGTTDAEGRFAWFGLEADVLYRVDVGGGMPGLYGEQFGFRQAPVPPAFVDVRARAAPLEFRMREAASVEGVVTGDFEVGTRIELYCHPHASPDAPVAFWQRLELDAEGAFAFRGLPPGRYGLVVTPPAGESDLLQEIDLATGERLRDVRLEVR